MSNKVEIYTFKKQKRYLLIASEVLSIFKKYEQTKKTSLEAGGILLGTRRPPHYEVKYASEPSIYDVRSRNGFTRRIEVHEKYATKVWKKSKGYIGYLGEWHTHPEPIPTPSSLDFTEWGKIIKRENKTCIFIIIGTNAYFVCEGRFEEGKLRFENFVSYQ